MVMRKATPARILPAGVLGWAFGLLAANPCGAQRRADLSAVPPLRVETPAREATWSRRIAARTVAASGAAGWLEACKVAGAFVGAAAAGLGAWKLLDDPYGPGRRVKGDEGYTPAANTAYAIGSYAGGTLVAYAIGRSDGSHGSLLATAAGAGVPSVPLFLGRNEPYLPLLGLVFGAPLQALGGTVGYQLTRHPRG